MRFLTSITGAGVLSLATFGGPAWAQTPTEQLAGYTHHES